MQRDSLWAGTLLLLASTGAFAQLPPLPAPQRVPTPPAATDAPYSPLSIVPGGVVVPLYQPGSKFLNMERVNEAETYNMSRSVPGRINSIVNIHNPSIEFHPVDGGLNTGAVIILVAGGGHRTLNVGGEAADFVPFFYNYGINTVILRNRLRADGYNAQTDAEYDAQQAVRMVRAYAKEWNLDPNKIGIMGFSAGAELASAAAVKYAEFDAANSDADDPLAGVSSRPDFAGIIYPGPTPFARNREEREVRRDTPPAFIACAGSGDRGHAVWAIDYYSAMLSIGVPNVEMHLYGYGAHPGSALLDGTRMSGGMTDRKGVPFGTWQYRFIDWARDLGFLNASGEKTKAAIESELFMNQPPPRRRGEGRGRRGRGGNTAPQPPAPGNS